MDDMRHWYIVDFIDGHRDEEAWRFILLVSGPLQQVVTSAMAVLSRPQIATMTKKMRDAMDNNPNIYIFDFF
jgi:hypothetical protein